MINHLAVLLYHYYHHHYYYYYHHHHYYSTTTTTQVEMGTVKVGMKVVAMPTRNQFEVQAVYINDIAVRSAKPGENVKVKLGGANVEDIQKG